MQEWREDRRANLGNLARCGCGNRAIREVKGIRLYDVGKVAGCRGRMKEAQVV